MAVEDVTTPDTERRPMTIRRVTTFGTETVPYDPDDNTQEDVSDDDQDDDEQR